MHKTIGILGGLGPFATLDLFDKILHNTPANKDQDHIHIIINNNPKIPSRVEAYYQKDQNLIRELKKSALMLEQAGVDFIIMPCNTAHIWIDQIARGLNVPFYNMIQNTARWVQEQETLRGKKIFLVGTSATVSSEIYQKAFQGSNIEIITPNSNEQKTINSFINHIKKGLINYNPFLNTFKEILHNANKKGITVILGGCTEIPLVFPFLSEEFIKIDPTLLLAKLAVRKALENS